MFFTTLKGVNILIIMSDGPLYNKSKDFAVRITNLRKYLYYQQKENVMSLQIYRSGTSIGANIAECQYAATGKDFINKLSIALKECKETIYWLEIIYRSGYIDTHGFESMYADALELERMLVSSINTMKAKDNPK